MQKEKIRVQATIENRESIFIYDSLRHKMRGKAIEMALKLFIKDKTMREFFFDGEVLKEIEKMTLGEEISQISQQQTPEVNQLDNKEEKSKNIASKKNTKIKW